MFSIFFQIILSLFGGSTNMVATSQQDTHEVVVVNEDIIERIKWLSEEGEPIEVIEALKEIPSKEIAPELRGYEAEAYMKMGKYRKALRILLLNKKGQQNTALWNSRVATCNFHLGFYDNAWKYFGEALKIEPRSGKIRWDISQCLLQYPFSERVERFWKWFNKNTKKIEGRMNPKDMSNGKLVELMAQGTEIIDNDIYFNIGGDNELTFGIEGCTYLLYLYPWLVNSMPESLKDKWTVYSCKQPAKDISFLLECISSTDIKVAAEYDKEKNGFVIRYYEPRLSELNDLESQHIFTTLLELIVGEGPVYNYVKAVRPALSPFGMVSLEELPGIMKSKLEEEEREYSVQPYMPYILYSFEPTQIDATRVRHDILVGTTRFMALNEEYLNGENKIYNGLAHKGAEAVMMILTQPENMDANEFVVFRNKVEDRIKDLFNKSVIQGEMLGAAYGACGVGYIDLLLYNRQQFTDYITQDEALDALLTLNDQTVCPTDVSLKSFSTYGRVKTIRQQKKSE